MTNDEIIIKINHVFDEYFEIPKEKLQPEAHIFNDLGLDSLDIIDLVIALQEEFNVRIRDDNRIRSLRTLGDLYQFVITLKEEGAFKKV